MVLEAIRYRRGSLTILNQLALPHRVEYQRICDSGEAWHAIKSMRVRGAPAIAIVAALGLAVELESLGQARQLSAVDSEIAAFVLEKLRYLVSSRPTAVNLANAAAELQRVVLEASHTSEDSQLSVSSVDEPPADERARAASHASCSKVKEAYVAAAERMLARDVEDNKAIGRFGADWIVRHAAVDELGRVSVLTHCNTGSLATAGYGTALGVIRSLQADSKLLMAYCTETRPYNQGSRLTAFELLHDRIPACLIADSMAAALLRGVAEEEKIAAVVVGADRVAANGDTANKIGTYGLAVLARYHGVKFLVAAPRTTIDLQTSSGQDIVIEERPGHEMTQVTGPVCDGEATVSEQIRTIRVAAPGIQVWNPAFDVTPADLIDGIITEMGVVEKDQAGVFHLDRLFDSSEPSSHRSTGVDPSIDGLVAVPDK